jgi:hypothetical protein
MGKAQRWQDWPNRGKAAEQLGHKQARSVLMPQSRQGVTMCLLYNLPIRCVMRCLAAVSDFMTIKINPFI